MPAHDYDPVVLEESFFIIEKMNPEYAKFNVLSNACSVIIIKQWKKIDVKEAYSNSKIFVRLIIGSINDYCICHIFFHFIPQQHSSDMSSKKVIITLLVIWKSLFSILGTEKYSLEQNLFLQL